MTDKLQDTQEEEIVSLASSFDNEVDPFEVEQAPVYDFDTTKVLGRNKYGGALLRSQWSDEDNAIDAARKAAGFVMPSNNNIKPSDRLGDMAAVSYSAGETFDTSEEALSGLPSYLSGIAEQRVVTDEEFNTRNYDPSEFARAGVSPKSGVSSRAATDATASYIQNNNIPLSIEVDGQTRYLTTGLGWDVYRKADENWKYKAGSYEDMGPVGTYSTLHVEPESALAGLPAPLRIGLAIGTGGVSEAALAVTKLATGETLHAMDYLSIALPSLEYAGILAPPVDAATAAQAGTDAMNAANAAGTGNAIAAGNAAQAAALAGTGILGLSYNASKALIAGAATGDPLDAITTAFGPAVVKEVIGNLGVGDALNTFASNNNINADDLNAGITKTIKALAQGDDIEDAVLKGIGKYVTEGGTILPDAVEDAFETAGKQLAALVEPVTDALSEINKNVIKPVTSEVGDVLSALDDNVIQPLTEDVGDALSQADTAVRQGAAEFDKEVLQPFTQPVGDVLEDVAQAAGDVVEDVGQEVGDVLSDAETEVRRALEDIDLPEIDIDLPEIDIDLPEIDIDLPDIDLNIPRVTVAPSATRTTGGLFDVAQFEHDEGISLIGNLLTGLTEQDANKLSRKQYQQPKEEVVDLLSDPFANAFNYKV